MEKKAKIITILIISLTVIIITIVLFWFFSGDGGGWSCNRQSLKCYPDPSGPYSSIADCANRSRCNKWSCSQGKCIPDPKGEYRSIGECLMDPNCGATPDEGIRFVPFGTNTCSGSNCPSESELNPGFYKIGWLRIGTARYLKTCDQNQLVDAIIDNYNCLSPSVSDLDLDLDGVVNVNSSRSEESRYFVELTNKVVNTAFSRGKLIVITPNLIAGELLKYYNNIQNDSEFNKLYNNFIAKYDRNFVKGVVYDTEYWDDNDDKSEGQTDCFNHSRESHRGHMHCLKKYFKTYFDVIAQKWAIKEPTWEIYINNYLESDMVDIVASVVNSNYNLGFQNQSYNFCPGDRRYNNSSEIKLRRQVDGSRLVWGFAGYEGSGDKWRESEYQACVSHAQNLGYYGIFTFGGICYLVKNNKLNSCSPEFKCQY